MMKYILLLLLMTLILDGKAQQQNNITFRNLTWEEASAAAARERKILFVDVVDGQERSVVKGKKGIFPDAHSKLFFDRNVVPIKIDITTPAGETFAPKLMRAPLPAYAFFMPFGDLLETIPPADVLANPDRLAEALKRALALAEIKKNNSRTVTFEKLEQALAFRKAERSDIPILFYIRPADCLECLKMEKNVLNLNKVADFYNDNFIRVIVEPGKEWEKYNIDAYPAFLFMNKDGKKITLEQGEHSEDRFMDIGRKALRKAEGIAFVDTTWQQILPEAWQQQKIIFADFYTSGGAERRALVQVVYRDPEVGEMFNAQFVNISQNVLQADNETRKYRDDMPEALCFIGTDGELIHRVTGVKDAADLLEQAKRAMGDRNLSAMKEKYDSGVRLPEFVEDYIVVAFRAGLKQIAAQVALDYLSGIEREKLKEEKYWSLFEKYVIDARSDLFSYVCADRAAFEHLFGQRRVGQKIQEIWIAGAAQFGRRIDGNYLFDEAGFKNYADRLKKEKVADRRKIVRDALMEKALQTEDWKNYINLAEEKWMEEQIPDAELYNWGVQINQKCRDKSLRYRAARWFALAASKMEQKERITGNIKPSSYKSFFAKLVDDLLQ